MSFFQYLKKDENIDNSTKLLVTGAAGYLGGTFSYEALKKGMNVIGIDNFSNSDHKNIDILESEFSNKFRFIEMDLACDTAKLIKKLKNINFDCLVHFAGLKSVSDSEKSPNEYWRNNIFSTINLAALMEDKQKKNIIFSSSATVYGDSVKQPIDESFITKPKSCYGLTKLASENILGDLARLNKLNLICLRYFNPVGCHSDFKIIEDISGNPSNIMPNILRAALEIDKIFYLFGDDYDTKDGTCIRDFIHVSDLIDGHFSSISKLMKTEKINEIINLGTGKMITIMELIRSFEKYNNIKLPIKIIGRRDGDIMTAYACPKKAKKTIGWSSKKSIEDICTDSWTAALTSQNKVSV